jgi:hypothetical protein
MAAPRSVRLPRLPLPPGEADEVRTAAQAVLKATGTNAL